MSDTTNIQKPRWGLYAALAMVLVVSLWIGWGDFDPSFSRTEVREGIRATIRGSIQFAVRYVIPVAILGFFASEWRNHRRTRQGREDPEA